MDKKEQDLRGIKKLFDSLGFDLDSRDRKNFLIQNFQVLKTLSTDNPEYSLRLHTFLFGPFESLQLVNDKYSGKAEDWAKRVFNEPGIAIFGNLFELDILKDFNSRGLDFQWSDRPDFIINHKRNEISIETTSAQFHEFKPSSTREEIKKKLSDVISDKFHNGYLTKSTALLIDTTNLYSHDFPEIVLNESLLQEILIEASSNVAGPSSKFSLPGLIQLFRYQYFTSENDKKWSLEPTLCFQTTICDPLLLEWRESCLVKKPADLTDLVTPRFNSYT